MNDEFKFRAKIILPIFSFGGMIIWGVIDGVRVIISSSTFFFNTLDQLTFIVFSAISYGILGIIIGFIFSFLPFKILHKNKELTLDKLIDVYMAAFSGITVGSYIFFSTTRLGNFIINAGKSFRMLILALISGVTIFILFKLLFQKIKFNRFVYKVWNLFFKKFIVITLILLITVSVMYKFYDSKWLKQKVSLLELPNIILISLDTLAANHVGCYGYSGMTTPSLDDFATHGILFKNVYSVSCWTLPSHISIFTSLYPSVHKVRAADHVLGEQWTTIAEILRDHGYYTGAFVDTGPKGTLGSAHGFNRGFNFYKHYTEKFDKYERLLLLGKVIGFYRRFYNRINNCDMHSELITKTAVSWLKHYRKRKPFFLFLHYFDIHSDTEIVPYEAPQIYIKQNDAIDMVLKGKLNGKENSKGATKQLQTLSWELRDGNLNKNDFDQEEIEAMITLYDAGISYTDYHIGILLNTLNEFNMTDNTIVVITADHGEEFLNHHQFMHYQYYNEVIKVPLIMRFPQKLPQNKIIDSPVRSIDILPTILDLVGISSYEQFQGTSLLPFVIEADSAEKLICYGGEDWDEETINAKYIIVNDQKLIVNNEKRANYFYNGGNKYEYYNLRKNPNEIKKLSRINRNKNFKKLYSELNKLNEGCNYLAAKEKVHKRLKLDKETKEKLKALGYIK